MNIKKVIALTGLIAATAGISQLAFAQDPRGYVGASVGQSSFRDGCTGLAAGVSCEDRDTAIGAFVGLQFNTNFGVELGYTDLGSVTASGFGITGDVKAKGIEFSAVGTAPINEQFSVYGKLGFFRWDVDAQAQGFGVGATRSDSGTDLTYAVGVQYNVTKTVGVRAQYQRYNDLGNEATTGTSDADFIGVGIVFKF